MQQFSDTAFSYGYAPSHICNDSTGYYCGGGVFYIGENSCSFFPLNFNRGSLSLYGVVGWCDGAD